MTIPFHEQLQASWKQRRHYMATMYLLGASYRQIGNNLGISPQAVSQSVRKEVPNDYKRFPTMSTNDYEYYHTIYNTKLMHYTIGLDAIAASHWIYTQHGVHKT